MIDRVEEKFDLKPARLVGDTNYGSAAILGWMVDEKQIEPHVPVFDKSERDDGTFSRSDFQWDEEANEYCCPAGNALRSDWRNFKTPRTGITKADTILYRSSQLDCAACPMKERCCPNTPIRKIPAASMRVRAMWHVRSRERMPTSNRVKIGKKWRCCLPTSSASGRWIACDYEAQAVRRMSFYCATAQNLRRMAK